MNHVFGTNFKMLDAYKRRFDIFGFFNFTVLEGRICVFVVLCINERGRQSAYTCFRGQTTKGIWIAKCNDMKPFTIAMDFEGTDSKARGEVLSALYWCSYFSFVLPVVACYMLCLIWLHLSFFVSNKSTDLSITQLLISSAMS